MSVQRITVIPDVQDVIAKEVALLSPQYTHLITSGGIGPTHDDVTFESIAMAFQEELYAHPELSRLVQEFFGVVDESSPAMKLAMVPRSAKLNYGTDPQSGKPLRYPLVSKCKSFKTAFGKWSSINQSINATRLVFILIIKVLKDRSQHQSVSKLCRNAKSSLAQQPVS